MALSKFDSVGQWVEEISGSAASPPSSDRSDDPADIPWALYKSCLSLLSVLVPYVALYPVSEVDEVLAGFTDDIGCLYLWGEGLNYGELNDVLAESEDLKNASLEILTSFGNTLTDLLFCTLSASTRIEDDVSILQRIVDVKKRTQDAERVMHESPALIPEALDASEDLEGIAARDVDDTVSSIEEVLEQVHVYTQCLMNLLPSIERSLRHTRHVKTSHHGVPPGMFKVSRPAGIYVRNIRDRFASADSQLTQRLGEANWQRHQRIRSLANASENNQSIKVEEAPISIFKPISEFRDSALGTSVRSQSSYAATVASHTSFASTTSEQESGVSRVPPTPKEVFEEIPFDCTICGKRLSHIRTRIEWKIHVFEDLQPYICTFSDCEDSLFTFPSRKLWGEHEFTKHRVDKSWTCLQCSKTLKSADKWKTHSASVHGTLFSDSQYQYAVKMAEKKTPQQIDSLQCPLCLTFPGRSKRNFISHVGKHLESISLVALPREDPGSDSESSSSKRSTDDNTIKIGQDDTNSLYPEIAIDSGGSLIDAEYATSPRQKTRTERRQGIFQFKLSPGRYENAYFLNSHTKSHTTKRPLVCTVCGKAFGRSDNRRRHEQRHLMEKKYVCSGDLEQGGRWGCEQRFASAGALNKHFHSEAGRTCVKPLLDDEAIALRRIEHERQGQLAPNSPRGFTSIIKANYGLPLALLKQYPDLVPLNPAILPQDNASVDIALHDEANSLSPTTKLTDSIIMTHSLPLQSPLFKTWKPMDSVLTSQADSPIGGSEPEGDHPSGEMFTDPEESYGGDECDDDMVVCSMPL